MKHKIALKQFSPISESSQEINEFFFRTEGPFERKCAVCIRSNGGKRLGFFTFASSYEEAVLFAKAAYPYPKIGLVEFEVHRVCKKRVCHCGGIHAFLFIENWATGC